MEANRSPAHRVGISPNNLQRIRIRSLTCLKYYYYYSLSKEEWSNFFKSLGRTENTKVLGVTSFVW